MYRAKLLLSAIRLMPHFLIYKFHPNRKIIYHDICRWIGVLGLEEKYALVALLTFFPEFRNLFYYRIGKCSMLLKWMCRPMETLYIRTKDIGPGLFIQHGFSTIIAARSIGKNCWINQQVTIGYSNKTDCPTLCDNVMVTAGAKIIGNVEIGNNSKVGSNAVVVKNVPPNCTVVGVPAYIIKRDGKKVKSN